MVGITFGSAPTTHSRPLTAVTSDVVGQPEGDPTAVIAVATGPTVTRVADGVHGWQEGLDADIGRMGGSRRVGAGASGPRSVAREPHRHGRSRPPGGLVRRHLDGLPALRGAGRELRPSLPAARRQYCTHISRDDPVARVLRGSAVWCPSFPPESPPTSGPCRRVRAAGAPVCVSGGASGSSGYGSSGAASSGTASSGARVRQHRFGHEQRCRGVTRARQCHHVGSAASLATIPERGGPERGGRRPLDQHRLRRVLPDPLPPPSSGPAAERGGPGHRRGRGPGGVRPGVRPLAPGVPRPKSARLHLHHGLPPVATAPTPQGSRARPFQCRPPQSQWR